MADVTTKYLRAALAILNNGTFEIVRFKVMVRPLKAMHIVHEKMGELLA